MRDGLQGWFEILRGGHLADLTGQVRDTDTVIDRAVSTFNASMHEPPLTIGPPSDTAPAWGWIKALRSEVVNGVKRLFMLPYQVHPQFGAGVMSGRYKKDGVMFYPDGRLKLVRFSGDLPPALPLAERANFAGDGGIITFEFSNDDGAHAPGCKDSEELSWADIQGLTKMV